MILINRVALKVILVLFFIITLPTSADNGINNKLIKVGVTASLTGVYKAQGESLLEGLQMWADDLNARGALLGKQVKIIYYDDQSDPEVSAQQYEYLISKDRVDLLVGPYSSDVTLRASDIAEKYQFPMVSGTAAASKIWSRGYENIFQVDLPATEYFIGGLQVAKSQGIQTVGIVFQESLFTKEVAMGAKLAAQKMGIDVVAFQGYSNMRTDFTSLIKTLVAQKPQLLLGATYFEDAVAIVRESKKQNFSPIAMGFTAGPSQAEFGTELGKDAENIVGFTPWTRAVREPLAYDFDFRYRRIYGRSASSNAAGGYAAGEILEAAVRLAKTLDKDKVREQLKQLSFISIVGRYKVDATGKQVGKSMYALQWQDNQRRLVMPTIYAETKFQFFVPWDKR